MFELDNFKPLIDSSPLLRHPVLEWMRRGDLTRARMRAWATQQFHFSISLPACFAALYARVPARYWSEKRALVELLRVEAWGASDPECHSLMFRELAEFLDLDIPQLTRASPAPYTQRYTATRLAICLGAHEHGGLSGALASVALGNEYLNLALFAAYRSAVTLNPELTGCPLGYFDAHLHDEEADFRVFAGLYELLPRTADQESEVKDTLEFLLQERSLYFDGLASDL